MSLDVTFAPGFSSRLKKSRAKTAHLVLVGTKPDIIKQAPLVLELKRRKQCVVFGDTGQHYDRPLTRDAQELAGVTPDFNLHVRGELYEKVGHIIARFGRVLKMLRASDRTIIPYAHGDTTTAMAVSCAAFMNEVPVVHVEAGLRSYAPRQEIFDAVLKNFSFPLYAAVLANKNNWQKGSLEPYPEQYNTRTIAPAAALHAAPVEINRKNLLAEGFREDRISVVGNPISDSIKLALKKGSAVFKHYPALAHGFIRCAIHRRENVASRHRFTVIMETLTKFIEEDRPVLLVAHALTRAALKDYRLLEKFRALARRHPKFIFEETLWPYLDNIAAMTKVKLNITDSGGEQEEGNILGVPTATTRFGSDRPETVWAGGNIIAPPISQRLFERIVRSAHNSAKMRAAPKLYGRNVAKKIVARVQAIQRREKLFQWEHERFGYSAFDFWKEGR